MVAGRRRWLDSMRWAKAQGLIDKIPTGHRRPRVRAASTEAIGRARGIAVTELEARAQNSPARRFEEMSLPEQLEALTRRSFEVLLAILDHPSDDSLELQRLQAKAARQLLSLCK